MTNGSVVLVESGPVASLVGAEVGEEGVDERVDAGSPSSCVEHAARRATHRSRPALIPSR
jgi:hypothetical protein